MRLRVSVSFVSSPRLTSSHFTLPHLTSPHLPGPLSLARSQVQLFRRGRERAPEYLCHGEAPTWALTERRGRFSCVRSAAGILEIFASRVTGEGRSRDFLNRLGRNAPRGLRLSSECVSRKDPLVPFVGRVVRALVDPLHLAIFIARRF